jgi:hypothetical protein
MDVKRRLGSLCRCPELGVGSVVDGDGADELDAVADLLDEAARRASADSMRTREATGRVLPFASGEGTRRDLRFSASPRGESNS